MAQKSGSHIKISVFSLVRCTKPFRTMGRDNNPENQKIKTTHKCFFPFASVYISDISAWPPPLPRFGECLSSVPQLPEGLEREQWKVVGNQARFLGECFISTAG